MTNRIAFQHDKNAHFTVNDHRIEHHLQSIEKIFSKNENNLSTDDPTLVRLNMLYGRRWNK
jgi:hypothetical protein